MYHGNVYSMTPKRGACGLPPEMELGAFLASQGDEPVANLVVQRVPLGGFLDTITDGNAKLPHLAGESLQKGSALPTPRLGVDTADRALYGDGLPLLAYNTEPCHDVEVQEKLRLAVCANSAIRHPETGATTSPPSKRHHTVESHASHPLP